MRLILLAMLLACALAASTDRVRRHGPYEKGQRQWPKEIVQPDGEGEDKKPARERRASKFEKGKRVAAPKKLGPNGEGEDQHTVVRRSAPALWESKHVCYEFGDDFTDPDGKMRDNVRKAMDEFEAVSCLKFTDVAEETDYCLQSSTSKIEIKDNEAGCWADVGCLPMPLGNRINVAPKCDLYDNIGVVMHEIFHALGRHHEHNRPDRDDFVIINEGNIESGQEHNFAKKSSSDFPTYGVPYDYLSLMHYGRTFFAIDKSNPTLDVVDERFKSKIGQQKRFSTLDVLFLNKMYECYTGGEQSCQHSGAMTANGWCYCVYPYQGDDCGDVASGVVHHQNDGTQTISVESTNYPNNYPLNTKTELLLECTDADKKAHIHFDDFEVEGYGCFYDKVSIAISASDLYPDVKCEGQMNDKSVTAEDNTMFLTLISDDMYTFKGFKLEFTCVTA